MCSNAATQFIDHMLIIQVLLYVIFTRCFFQAPQRFDEDSRFAEGLSSDQINQLPTRVFKSGTDNETTKPKSCKCWTKNADNLDTTDREESSASANEVEARDAMEECPVCMNKFVNNEQLRILPCFHEFHTNCIDKWINVRMASILE